MTSLRADTCRTARQKRVRHDLFGRLLWQLAIRFAALGIGCSLVSEMASAQNAIQPQFDPVVLPDYSRNRNVSVDEAQHPDYDPLGIDLGSFQVFPSLTETSQGNSNVLFNDFDKHADIAAFIQPTVFAQSDWSNGLLQVYATDQIREDLNYKTLNKNSWSAHLNGRIDISDALNLNAFVEVGHFTENPFSSVVDGNFAVLSQFNQASATLKGVWTQGKMRITAEYDHFSVQYSPLWHTAGAILNQAYRDNRYDRQMVQSEYSLSPSLALYSQINFDTVKYRHTAEFGLPNRNSAGVAIVSGFSFDLSGVARGAVGLGYSRRTYAGGPFANPSGLSIQTKIEVFPSTSTTLTGSAYRLLRDASISQSVAYYDMRVEFDVAYALRQNVILSTRIYYGNQEFVEDPRRRMFYQANLGGKIKFNRRFNANVDLGYSKSTTNRNDVGAQFRQFIGLIAIQYRI